jgi:hypothetical protein
MKGKGKGAIALGLAAILLVGLAAVTADSTGKSQQVAPGHPLAALATSSDLRAASTQTGSTPSVSSSGPTVGQGTFDGVSPAVNSLPVLPVPPLTTIAAHENESLAPNAQASSVKDPVVQSKKGIGPISAPIANFDGMCLPASTCSRNQWSDCACLPPDPNGDVGTNQYVQMVNQAFAVYSKTGSLLRPATDLNQLWAGTSSECAEHNDGDPVVVYDQLAKRWLLSQFIAEPNAGEQYGECIAVSTSNDATGSYYLYTFLFGTSVFYDYPKIGVWPDGYYMTANEFPAGQVTSSGAAAFAFERSKMLAGQPARYVLFDESAYNPPGSQYVGQLPGDLDGSTLPPTGTPVLFAEVDDPTSVPPTTTSDLGFDLRLWRFHVDWSNPASSTFGSNGAPSYTLPVAPFARPQCVYGYGTNCVPQESSAQTLDTIGDRLMYRLAYRNFGDHASLVLNHSVVADGRIGIRWYEVRIPTGGSPSIYQQGTYAPDDPTTDPLWRWMGSVAMDHVGDIALGFSGSGPNDNPSVRYTGRAAGDPAGQMTQTEQVAYTGGGPQTEVLERWGDYSDLTVDPTDDCTFWYTQEYLGPPILAFGSVWRTRIVSFKFPGCKK